jgi:hypothetical protein
MSSLFPSGIEALIESSILDLTVGDFFAEKNTKKIHLKSEIITKLINMKIDQEIRELNSFEMDFQYYIDSWINGNKNHVKQELTELNKVSNIAFNRILFNLPREMQEKIIYNL